MTAKLPDVLTLLLVEEKTRNNPPFAAIHHEAIDTLTEIAKEFLEDQKKRREAAEKEKAEEEAHARAQAAKEAEEPEEEEATVGRR